MNVLGLDIGSSSIKGAVLDLVREQIGTTVVRPFPAAVAGLPPGRFEVSPAAVETESRQVLSELLQSAPDAEALFVTGQMGGLVLTDEAGGAVANYYSWRDQRTLEPLFGEKSVVDELRARWDGDVLASLGNELQPGSTTSLLCWLAAQNELPPGTSPVSIADFVIGRLCGIAPKTHVTHAIGMLDLRAVDWHLQAFEALAADGVRWPELIRDVIPAGTWRAEGRSLDVYGAYGDQQCALFGTGLQRGELSINASTGSQVSQRIAAFTPGAYQTRCYFESDLLNTITHLPAGRSLNVIVDLLTELAMAEGIELKDTWNTIVQRASGVEESDLHVDLAFFAGPFGSTGSVSGITTENLTVGHLFRASFRAMANNYGRAAQRLDAGESWRSVVLSGGLTRTVPPLHEMIAARFPVLIREAPGEETLLGLLRLAKDTL